MDNLKDAETTARLELRALERMISALCEHTERLSHDARGSREGNSRETDFQIQAFEERRAQALEALRAQTQEPCEIRITRLQQLAEALDCSRTYFRPSEAETEQTQWAIRLG